MIYQDTGETVKEPINLFHTPHGDNVYTAMCTYHARCLGHAVALQATNASCEICDLHNSAPTLAPLDEIHATYTAIKTYKSRSN